MENSVMKRKKVNKLEEKGKITPLAIVTCALLVFYVVAMVILLIWAFSTSFKDQTEFRLNPVYFPEKPVWNYTTVFNMYKVPIEQGEVGMAQMFVNSFLYAIGCAVTSAFTPFLAAYLCARYRYYFSKVIYAVVIVTMTLPIVGSLPSEILIARTLGFYDNIWGLWIMKANFLGMYFLVFHGLLTQLPAAYSEAAKLDGAGNMTILWRIMMPLSRNTIFTVMLINFIGFWNDYSIPLIYLPSYPTIAIGMEYMGRTNINSMSTVPMRMTAAMLMLIPILTLFLIFHRRLIGNLTVGGLKG